MDLRGFYSGKDNVTFIYTIDGYPSQLPKGYRNLIRNECGAGVRVSFVSSFEKTQIFWNSPSMKSKLRTWQTVDMDADDVTVYNMHNNLNILDSQEWRRASIEYLTKADIRRKRKLFLFRSVMYVSGTRGEDFDDSIKQIEKLCADLGIKATRVMFNVGDYLSALSPFSLRTSSTINKLIGANVLTDELLARFSKPSHGTLGNEGQIWGSDLYTHSPVLKVAKETTESAECWLVSGEIGSGKSFFVKFLVLQLLALKGYNGTIMDIEGFEYIPLAKYVSINDEVVILNMAEGQGLYFDPVEIIHTGDPDNDDKMYSLCKSFTLSMFKVLMGGADKLDDWVDNVLNDAVSNAYIKVGVLADDMSTWHRSRVLTIFDVYKEIKKLIVDTSQGAIKTSFEYSDYQKRTNPELAMAGKQNDVLSLTNQAPEYQSAVRRCLSKLSRYFEKGGTQASVFKKKVTIDRIANCKLLICSFGMAGKSKTNVDPIQLSLMMLCAANMSYLRSIFSKTQGKFNFKLWEEFQRMSTFSGSKDTISTAITGGRKLGDINIIVTNDLKALVEEDEFSILENIQSFAIGAIGDANTRRNICDILSCPQMVGELDKLAIGNKNLKRYHSGDNLSSSPYKNGFLVGLDRSVYALTKATVPYELASSDIFRTGININDEDELEALRNDLESVATSVDDFEFDYDADNMDIPDVDFSELGDLLGDTTESEEFGLPSEFTTEFDFGEGDLQLNKVETVDKIGIEEELDLSALNTEDGFEDMSLDDTVSILDSISNMSEGGENK